jgi:hypothetical protein
MAPGARGGCALGERSTSSPRSGARGWTRPAVAGGSSTALDAGTWENSDEETPSRAS